MSGLLVYTRFSYLKTKQLDFILVGDKQEKCLLTLFDQYFRMRLAISAFESLTIHKMLFWSVATPGS